MKTSFIRGIILVEMAGAILIGAAPHASAKEVKLEWEVVEGAIGYELRIERAGQELLRQRLSSAKWKGQLDPGICVFQVRGIDKVNKPGKWSELAPLVVMTTPPELDSPKDDAEFVFFNPNIGTTLRWKTAPNASKYAVEVKRGSESTYKGIIEGTQLDLGFLPPGEYEWTVKSVLEPPPGSPSSLHGRQWTSEASSVHEFTIEHRALGRPVPISPPALLPPPSSGRLTFRWRTVDGAEAYEIRIAKASDRDFSKAKAVFVSGTSNIFAISTEGGYKWTIRALANLDNDKKPRAVGPETISQFKLDRTAIFAEASGYLAFSLMTAPYTYEVISPAMGFRGSTSSSAMTLRLSAEYWFRPQLGLGLAGEDTTLLLNRQNFHRRTFEAVAKYRAGLNEDRYGWFIAPKAGFEGRQYLGLTPEVVSGEVQTTLHSETVTALGGAVGVDIRKQLTERWSLGTKFSYFIPLVLSGTNGGSLSGEASYRNVSFGAQGMYWFNRKWGVSAGGFVEKRSISYLPSGATVAEQISMDGAYFFGSVLYSFGQ